MSILLEALLLLSIMPLLAINAAVAVAVYNFIFNKSLVVVIMDKEDQ